MGLKTGVWAARLGFGVGGTKKEKEEKEEEKIPHMFESIGHRTLQGRCPTKISEFLPKMDCFMENEVKSIAAVLVFFNKGGPPVMVTRSDGVLW